MLKRIIGLTLALALATGLYFLINQDAPADRPEVLAAAHDGFTTLLQGDEFSTIAATQGAIYAGGMQGLFKIDPLTLAAVEIKNGERSFQSVRALYADQNDLWVGHDDGLSIIRDGQVIRTIGKEDGLVDPRVIDLLRVDNTTIYAATFSGLAIIREGSITFLANSDDLPGETIKVMLKDSVGFIWLGAYDARGGGVVIQKGDVKQAFDIETGLVHNCVTSIAETPDHQVLVGGGLLTEGGASLFNYDGQQWQIVRTIQKENGLAGEKVRHIFVDRSNRIWFCSEYDGVAIFRDTGDSLILTTADGLSDNEVKKIVQAENGDYWLATRDGVTRVQAAAIFG